MNSGYALGIDLGATNVKAIAIDDRGEVLRADQFETSDAEGRWLDRIKDHVRTVEQALGNAEWIGIAAPGLVSRDNRGIAWMQGRLAGLEGLDWTKSLNRSRAVTVLNDAHAALLGEAWLGAARGAANAAMLTLGTGVGGAILCDGRLLRGHLGRAGHLGHLSLNPDGPLDIVNAPGSIEDQIGDHTLCRRSGGRFASTAALMEAHLCGDRQATEVLDRSLKALAAAITSIINIADPEVVIVGGGIARAGPAIFDPLKRFLDDFEWRPHGHRVRIVAAALGERAGAIGAARHAMRFEGKEDQ